MCAYRVVHHAEDHNKLGEEQALTYLDTRVTKACLGTFDSDTKSYYYRIFASLALIATRILGKPEVAFRLHGQTIDTMKHLIETALGTSESYYSNKDAGPLLVSGEGSGGSLRPWLASTGCNQAL
jgi:hypothetical protein